MASCIFNYIISLNINLHKRKAKDNLKEGGENVREIFSSVSFCHVGENLVKITFYPLTTTSRNSSISLVGAIGFEPMTR